MLPMDEHVENNFIPNENDFITPCHEMKNIDAASHDLLQIAREDLRDLVLRELQQKKKP